MREQTLYRLMLILLVSLIRTGVALLGALALYVIREPAQTPYWSAFLVGSIASLIAETALAMRAIARAGAANQTPEDPDAKRTEENRP